MDRALLGLLAEKKLCKSIKMYLKDFSICSLFLSQVSRRVADASKNVTAQLIMGCKFRLDTVFPFVPKHIGHS